VFGYAGLKAWNSLPDYLRCGDLSLETFKRQLKTFLFAHYYRIQRIRGSLNDSALYKLTFIIIIIIIMDRQTDRQTDR